MGEIHVLVERLGSPSLFLVRGNKQRPTNQRAGTDLLAPSPRTSLLWLNLIVKFIGLGNKHLRDW